MFKFPEGPHSQTNPKWAVQKPMGVKLALSAEGSGTQTHKLPLEILSLALEDNHSDHDAEMWTVTASPPEHLVEGGPSDVFFPDTQPLSPNLATVPTPHMRSSLHTSNPAGSLAENTLASLPSLLFGCFMAASLLGSYYHRLMVTSYEQPSLIPRNLSRATSSEHWV